MPMASGSPSPSPKRSSTGSGASDPQSDGLTAASQFRSHPVIEVLKARIGKPGVTSSEAAQRRLPRLASVDTLIDGFGRPMQEF
jgi:maleate cis-trans isomerase